MADVNRMFMYLEKGKNIGSLKLMLASPTMMHKQLISLIEKEIKSAKSQKPASIILKLNSLSDEKLILKLEEAAKAGVKIKMVIRSICCMQTENKKFKKKVNAISIVDEYLEHARVMIFHHEGKEKVFLSSADWMVRNLDHRVEVACPVLDKNIQQELKDILNIQLNDNVKARTLVNDMGNDYVNPRNAKKIRSQIETYNYLLKKNYKDSATGSY